MSDLVVVWLLLVSASAIVGCGVVALAYIVWGGEVDRTPRVPLVRDWRDR